MSRITLSVVNKNCNPSSNPVIPLPGDFVCLWSLKAILKGLRVVPAAMSQWKKTSLPDTLPASSSRLQGHLFHLSGISYFPLQSRDNTAFFLLSLCLLPALHPRHLPLYSSRFGVLVQALCGLWKAHSAAPKCKQLSVGMPYNRWKKQHSIQTMWTLQRWFVGKHRFNLT